MTRTDFFKLAEGLGYKHGTVMTPETNAAIRAALRKTLTTQDLGQAPRIFAEAGPLSMTPDGAIDLLMEELI